MLHGYFNYATHIAETRWDRRAFLRNWWRIYGGDTRWAPPHYPSLYRAIVAAKSEFLARQRPIPIYLDAYPDTRPRSGSGLPSSGGPIWETPVCAAVLLTDTRRLDRTAYLALLHCVNDVESLERFVYIASEQASFAGYRRLVGPTGLSPHLQSGVLQDYFHITPPLHTPYNPPYVPEIMQGALTPLQHSRLYRVITSGAQVEGSQPAKTGTEIVRLNECDWQRLLVPLFGQIFDDTGEFPRPDEEEAAFLLEWLSVWPLTVWAAMAGDKPVGFMMLQPDLAPAVTRARGGRNPLWRAWLSWRSRRPVKSGRLLFGGVTPNWRERGVGDQLWRRAIMEARSAGWQTLTVGPLPPNHPAVPFLLKRGAEARQSYMLYAFEL